MKEKKGGRGSKGADGLVVGGNWSWVKCHDDTKLEMATLDRSQDLQDRYPSTPKNQTITLHSI